MKKLLSTIAVFLIAIGIFTPAHAYQSGFGLAIVGLESFYYSMDYYLEGGVEGEGSGYSSAGFGALLGIYENYAAFSVDGDWQGVMNSYDDVIEEYWVDDATLHASLYLGEGHYFTMFAGAFADACAKENAPVPEPATLFLLGTGLIGIIGLGRMRFSKE